MLVLSLNTRACLQYIPQAELEEEEPSSMLAARGKSALISVWESRWKEGARWNQEQEQEKVAGD